MKKNLLLLAILCLSTVISYSKTNTTKGKEFWLAYMENLNLMMNGNPVFSLVISSETNTSGTVEIPATGFSIPFTVTAMQTTEVYLPNSILYPEGDEDISNTGIKITANDSINVYAYHHRLYFSDATLVVPVQELSASCMVTAQKDDHNINPSEMVVMATRDSTVISITPSVLTLGLRPAGVPFNITLNAGQIFQLQAYGDLSGTILSSTDSSKKIAAFSGARQAYIHCNNNADSHLYDMDYNAMFGTKFIAVPTFNSGGDPVKILTSSDSNYVRIDNGSPIFLQYKGAYIDTFITSASSIMSEKPVAVSQFIKSMDCNTSLQGDPNMVVLPPIDLLKIRAVYKNLDGPQNATTIYTPNHYLNIITKSSLIPNVTLDGLLLNGFQPISSNIQYSYLQISVSAGTHTLHCNSGFNAFTYDVGDYNAAAYHLGYDFKDTLSTGIFEHDINIKSILYPDPFSDKATLTVLSATQLKNANFIIYSSEGKIILQKTFSGNTVTIVRNQMKTGLYFYLILTNNNLISKGKFVVN